MMIAYNLYQNCSKILSVKEHSYFSFHRIIYILHNITNVKQSVFKIYL